VGVDDGFKLLEEKVKRAAERMRQLASENQLLKAAVAQGTSSLEEAARRAEAADKRREAAEKRLREVPRINPEEAERLESLAGEVKGLRREREEIRARIAKLVETLDGLE
jgi:chromosome segregation ATPase